MIEELLENKTIYKIVYFFLANPERAFFQGELKRKFSSKSLNLYLNSLVKVGFLKAFTKKGRKYFRINKSFPGMQKLKYNLKPRRVDDELGKFAKRVAGLRTAVLTGVFTGNPHLGCDLVLIGKMRENRTHSLVELAERLMGQEINYAVFTKNEFEQRKNIFDRFMKDVFENDHLILAEK